MAETRPSERRLYRASVLALLAISILSALAERTHFIARGTATDWLCQILPPFVLAPWALAALLWGALRATRVGPWVGVAIAAALVLGVFLWASIWIDWIRFGSGWQPGA